MSAVTLTLPALTERKLREKASTEGLSLERYLERRLDELAGNGLATAPDAAPSRTFDDILAPVRQGFAESGMTEDELAELLRESREEVWREKKGGNTSP